MSSKTLHPVLIATRDMLAELQITPADHVGVGVSGGVDSMVLLHVLRSSGYRVSALHVNFQLRGEASDQDALFVASWCHERQIALHTYVADTLTYADLHGLNTQLAARQIRYHWWDQLLGKNQIDFVATAHHLDDNIESVLMNLFRGTGTKGLQGIPVRRDAYIRPLLGCSRVEVEEYARVYDVAFRNDVTNEDDAYDRNRIRHHVVPALQEIYPGFYSRLRHTLHRLRMEWEDSHRQYRAWVMQYIVADGSGFRIAYDQNSLSFLLRWLEEKGMPWQLAEQYVTAKAADSGSVLAGNGYLLSRTKTGFFLESAEPPTEISIPSTGHYRIRDMDFVIEEFQGKPDWGVLQPGVEFIDAEVVEWPLTIRPFRPGDRFQPLGMHGHSKKLQDFLVDMKLESHEKTRLRLLSNAHHIIWVMGYRLDERAGVRKRSTKMYRLSYTRHEAG